MTPDKQTDLDEFQKTLVRILHKETIDLVEMHARGHGLEYAQGLRARAKKACLRYAAALQHSRSTEGMRELLDAVEYHGPRYANIAMNL